MAKATSGTGSGTHNVYSSFPIAAIGGSEGSLQALQELIRQLPQQPGLTLVYLPNLYETGAEDAAGLLSSETEMKVVVAEHGQALQPDHIYLLDPEQDNRLAQEKFQITRKKDTGAYPAPFDQWLASLAENDSHPLIGILLSGSAIDGITGLRTLQSAGGLTLVQDETAVSLSGPKTAVAQGVADKVLPPPAMAEELIALVERSGSIQEKGVILQEPEISENDENLARIIQYLKKSIGVDFTHYKMNTIKRRITRRMLLHKLSFLSDYLQYLKQHTGEVSLLYQDLLINVTTFFRDPDALEYLKKTLLPRILRNKSASDPLRIWVPACSTGEEPYTLAIILMEFLGDKAANIPIQIFATDLSELAIAKARLGVYSRDELANINPQQLQRFFTKIDGSYRIIKPIRDLCVYAPHNVFKDPPFSRLDLISCCNLMIYMDTVLHKKLLSTFHYSLNPEGLLVLGKSETIGSSVQLFTQLEKRFKIYVKKESSTHGLFDMNYRLPHLMGNSEKSELHQSALKRTQYVSDLEKMVDEVLLSKYVPASVVISLDLEILQFKGSTGLYLEPAPGKASLNLMKMAKPGLGFEVRNLVNKCNKTGQTVRKKNIEVNWQEKRLLVSVEVMPLRPSGEDRLFLVVFEQCAPEAPPESRKDFSRDKLVHQLQEELIAVKDDMRSIIEEQEASNEELQSANEEIISSNEELQSINEELETSKEELESTN
ncbi:MAG TPA: CheR family methyltransferase, partial [Chitinophagaceae bacterium]|nr:CheR family methyltransferase [Chitinophagaceae bacterium]